MFIHHFYLPLNSLQAMLQAMLIGHLGADAESKSTNGNEFITFRIANTDRWTDDAGQVHEQTTWVDCIMNGKPKVFDYLKKGQLVYVIGSVSLRVYSSAKDRCMKAGMTINVRQVELLGGKSDDVPSLLYTEDGKEQVHVEKLFYSPAATNEAGNGVGRVLVSRSGERFLHDSEGWVVREAIQPE